MRTPIRQNKGWPWQQRLAVAVLAACHHSEFKTTDQLEHVVASGEMVDVIEAQLASLDWEALDRALGITCPRLKANNGVCDKALDDFDDVCRRLHEIAQALRYRLQCQLARSVLLEADKAFLPSAPNTWTVTEKTPGSLSPALVDDF